MNGTTSFHMTATSRTKAALVMLNVRRDPILLLAFETDEYAGEFKEPYASHVKQKAATR